MATGLKRVTNFLLGVDEDYEDEYGYEDDDYEYEEEDVIMNRFKPPTENISKHKRYSTLGSKQASVRGSARGAREVNSNIRNIHSAPTATEHSGNAQIDISYPQDIDSARDIIDNIKNGVYSIVNLESVDSPLAQRIADFLSGAVAALEGNIRRLSHDMFIITPSGVEITGEIEGSEVGAKLKSSGINLSWLSSR